MKKVLVFFLIFIVVASVAYYSGPVVEFNKVSPEIDLLDIPIEEIDAFISSNERMVEGIKPENESMIVWADSVRKTEYAIVYLHGFSAGVMESRPVHFNLAKKFGCNLYLPRLSKHGLEGTESFLEITPSSLMNSAKEAIAVGQILGEKVIVMSCSTGGTLSIYLAAHNPDLIHSQLLFSPNIEIYDGTVKIVNDPWGENILKSIVGDYSENLKDKGTEKEKYWTLKYRSEGIIALQDLIEQTMTPDVFAKVAQPYMIGYYYKNEEEQDKVVSVKAMLDFYEQTATPNDQKKEVAFPNVGDHVIPSDITSQDWETVQAETAKYMEDVLGLTPTD